MKLNIDSKKLVRSFVSELSHSGIKEKYKKVLVDNATVLLHAFNISKSENIDQDMLNLGKIMLHELFEIINYGIYEQNKRTMPLSREINNLIWNTIYSANKNNNSSFNNLQNSIDLINTAINLRLDDNYNVLDDKICLLLDDEMHTALLKVCIKSIKDSFNLDDSVLNLYEYLNHLLRSTKRDPNMSKEERLIRLENFNKILNKFTQLNELKNIQWYDGGVALREDLNKFLKDFQCNYQETVEELEAKLDPSVFFKEYPRALDNQKRIQANTFALGKSDLNSVIRSLPKEIISQIVTTQMSL